MAGPLAVSALWAQIWPHAAPDQLQSVTILRLDASELTVKPIAFLTSQLWRAPPPPHPHRTAQVFWARFTSACLAPGHGLGPDSLAQILGRRLSYCTTPYSLAIASARVCPVPPPSHPHRTDEGFWAHFPSACRAPGHGPGPDAPERILGRRLGY